MREGKSVPPIRLSEEKLANALDWDATIDSMERERIAVATSRSQITRSSEVEYVEF